MPLSWNEIRSNSIEFAKEWATESRENAEAKTFWDQFFRIFGLNRRLIASFEEPVKNIKGQYGFIDVFWKAVLLAEHKSAGKDLDKAASQAFEYIQSLARENRHDEIPRYVILSDFRRFVLFDLETDAKHEFLLGELYKNVDKLAFIPGYKQHDFAQEDPINIKAVQIMGDLHDTLEAGGYTGHDLERLLVRILFCLFAEDTGIFERNAFQLYIENHTLADGSNVGAAISEFFAVLNKPVENRQSGLREELADLPYVNGELFAEMLGFPAFDRAMRNSLIAATRFDWSQISPAVFGALFQAVMEPSERRKIGAHYTSERDILKLIGPLFLDELKSSLDKSGRDRNKLKKLHERMGQLKFLDPACGCGNFLVIAYRELRIIELEILKRLVGDQKALDVSVLAKVDVDQMYGIEIEEWPARIAEVAMWLMDHQMNLQLSEQFGEYFVRLPLKKSPHIVHGNALTIDWTDVLPIADCSFILGNPPFIGSKYQSKEQRAEVKGIVGETVRGVGLLDYVTAWYFKAARYIQDTDIRVAFVSTNSISQGEQVGVLWGELLKLGIHINFAHRTFAWQSEARGAAHVHVVIIGFSDKPLSSRRIFDYEHIKGDPQESEASRISPYLVDAPNLVVTNRSSPLCDIPAMTSGNKPIDDGNYLFEPEERAEFLRHEPNAERLFLRWLGGREFIQGIERYCLYLGDVTPAEVRGMPLVMERVKNVREFRSKSKSTPTQKLAAFPMEFHTKFRSTNKYLAMPQVSSERRDFIPIAFLGDDVLCGDKLRLVPDATLFHFGVMCSTQHMSWVRQVSGRLKSDYQYSAKLVYNNFPWPQDVTVKQRDAVETSAAAVLAAREQFPDASLADLYDPLSMPSVLTKAHAKLDRAVDRCYRSQPFPHERNRVEFLFELYERLSAPLVAKKKTRRKKAGTA
ncbi:class I SAM-dependent DNA methyltransferase [Crateriforma conspicua]|uniref:site-specific DNA-methyltransferase (adenine-specific) n=1 Tax=Crateriforma conspicua TaxID=2527996 RepID=A0A5C5Y3K0_9PLAN|nr:DNA methyltransferase [Crateriforma conspicua]TWT69724.1 hypothetical protein Pan14r_20160 [Crateriforma conspicua]